MPVAQELHEQNGEDEECGDETVLFDNLQSQDEDPASDDGEGLKGPLSFVLDDCPFGPGVMTVLKSMSRGEECEAWLDPKHGPGETMYALTHAFGVRGQKQVHRILAAGSLTTKYGVVQNIQVLYMLSIFSSRHQALSRLQDRLPARINSSSSATFR